MKEYFSPRRHFSLRPCLCLCLQYMSLSVFKYVAGSVLCGSLYLSSRPELARSPPCPFSSPSVVSCSSLSFFSIRVRVEQHCFALLRFWPLLQTDDGRCRCPTVVSILIVQQAPLLPRITQQIHYRIEQQNRKYTITPFRRHFFTAQSSSLSFVNLKKADKQQVQNEGK